MNSTAWRFTLLVLASLVVATGAHAQQPPGANGGVGPGAPLGGETTVLRSFQPPPPIRSGQPITVMVFPGINASGTGGQEIADYLVRQIKAGMIFSNRYVVVTYYPRSSLVRRAVTSTLISEDELTRLRDPNTGEIDPQLARLVATRLGIQAIMLVSIDALTINREQGAAEVTGTVQIVGSVGGEAIAQVALTGRVSGQTGKTDVELAEAAAAQAASQIQQELGVKAPEGPTQVGTPPPPRRTSRGLRIPPWLGVALFVAGLGSGFVH